MVVILVMAVVMVLLLVDTAADAADNGDEKHIQYSHANDSLESPGRARNGYQRRMPSEPRDALLCLYGMYEVSYEPDKLLHSIPLD